MGVKVHLEGDGLLFDDETSVFNAAQIIGFLKNSDGLNDAGQKGASPQVTLLGSTKPRTSPRQVLQESGAKTNPQKIAALGHYQAEQAGHESFTIDEVKIAFKRAGEPLPKNLGRDVQTAVNSDLIYEENGESGHYLLSEKALEYLDTGFPDQGKNASRSKREGGRRPSGSARTVLNEELLKTLKQKNTSLQEFIQAREAAYSGSASSQVTIIATWLLDEMSMDSISASDLMTVRRHRGEEVGNPSSQLNNAKARDGYFSHTTGGRFFLSNAGEDFGRVKSKD